MLSREPNDALRYGHDPPWVDNRRADPLIFQSLGHLKSQIGHGPHRDDQHVLVGSLSQHIDPVVEPSHGLVLVAYRALREPHDGRGIGNGHGLPQLFAQSRGIAGGTEPDVWHHLQDGEIPHSVVTRAVRPGDARAVEHERHTRFVQRHVHEHLIEGAVDEGGVEGDHRMQAAECHPGSGCHRVLLRYADVEDAIRIFLSEAVEPGRTQHGRGDSDDLGVGVGDLDDLVGENRCPGLLIDGTERFPGLGVDLADGVKLVG